MKICTKCFGLLPLSEYYRHTQVRGGYHSECKKCLTKRTKENHKTKSGLIAKMYNGQRQASKQRGHPKPAYTLNELLAWVVAQSSFHTLSDAWVDGGYERLSIPSCDRINSLLPYTLDNLQVVTCDENISNGHRDMSNGIFGNTTPVLQKNRNGDIVGRFKSTTEAERLTGTHHTHICELLRTGGMGVRKSANGFIWEKWKNAQW